MTDPTMTDTPHGSLNAGHPAPEWHDIPAPATLFALGAAPVAWLAQLLAGFATTSYVCFTGLAHAPPPGVPGWLQPLLAAVNIAALLIALAGLATGAWFSRRGAGQAARRAAGQLGAREGRTRFLVTFSMFSSAIFCVGILANSFSLFVVPLCRS
jgi:hypothetical protein